MKTVVRRIDNEQLTAEQQEWVKWFEVQARERLEYWAEHRVKNGMVGVGAKHTLHEYFGPTEFGQKLVYELEILEL